ncbi:MAG TPA: carbohydrate ABC transporter permease [Candidatus Limiplasma pullicola]|nr:carbohydrate ABC transporter permease [Candidatus Limiplasma pullicola]
MKAKPQKPGTHRILPAVAGYIILAAVIVVALFPALWMFISSLKDASEIFSLPPSFVVEHPSFENYHRVLFETTVPRAFFNSLLISSTTTALVILIASFAAYGFARFALPGGKALSTSLLFGQMMPAVVLLVPLFKIYSAIGFIDTYRVNIITNLAVNMPMAVLTMTAFFRSIPEEMDEAAMIDGCSRIGAMFRVVMPNSAPGLVTAGIFAFLNTWEEFMFSMNFVNSAKYKTLAVAIKEFKGQFIIDWGGMMSAAVVISFPVLLVFLFCNKYFIKGLTSGSVKG